jgi:transcriptional regulator with XRE-family HTH domain
MDKPRNKVAVVPAVHLRALRMAAGMTQDELGDKANVNPMMLSQMECGYRGVSMLTARKLCDVLGVSIDTLIDRVPPQGPCSGFTPHDLRPIPADLKTAKMYRKRRLTVAEAEHLAEELANVERDSLANGVIPAEVQDERV